MLGLDLAYLFTKFDDCSYRRSREMVGANKNLNGSLVLTTPTHGLALDMANLSTKFEVSISTHYEDMKGDTKCRKWGSLVVRGHSRLLTIAPFDRAHTTFY